jgi:uncharacterized protein (DUF2252 family)
MQVALQAPLWLRELPSYLRSIMMRAERDLNIHKATRRYEGWLGGQIPLIAQDLRLKHTLMRQAVFPFLRGTFYRWCQLWPEVCPEVAGAPVVLAVGDLHVENFGTWRDREGRLVWGINDFDEVAVMPYTMDLVRLAASACMALEAGHLRTDAEGACDSILTGYREALKGGRAPGCAWGTSSVVARTGDQRVA